VTEIVPLTHLIPTPDSAASGSDVPVLAAPILDSIQGGVVTIGNFDGVHLGHAALLSEVRRFATELGGPAVAVVLDPHPASILRPERAPKRLTWIERRAELMHALGIDALVVCETTPTFLNMTAAEFFDTLVVGRLRARAMIEGPNFFFGRDRGGDVALLKELCGTNQLDLRIVEPTNVDAEMISSTRIRGLLESGKVEPAARLLGIPHRIRGTVAEGAQRGRQIGFPTANLTDIDVVVPGPGVYGGIATLERDRGGKLSYDAAIHIGPSPTFESDGETKVEIHLLDYGGNLYGQVLLVDFMIHVRDIARFDSAERLVEQLDQDIHTIRSGLAPFHTS
jgi:riboflavin kinase/FMN adenylyltransferase